VFELKYHEAVPHSSLYLSFAYKSACVPFLQITVAYCYGNKTQTKSQTKRQSFSHC